ncbi:MAG TPA: plasmid pRiA4b ORF-3 family protein [Thermoanaerobaculia bacterium]|nr:plasmid pRiA4b ORF-3 family protein [Thermoanaerobaculia bacterium]
MKRHAGTGTIADRVASLPRICRLEITLRGIEPPIWRGIEVRDDITLGRLHRILQDVMGWTDSHLHAFEAGGKRYGIPDREWGDDDTISERRVKLRDLLSSGIERFSYEYDFGDDWQHDIVVEGRFDPEPDIRYPRCRAGDRSCPPEDCGGVTGYQEMLDTLFDPRDPEFKNTRSWIAGWESEAFDLEAINRRLWRLR